MGKKSHEPHSAHCCFFSRVAKARPGEREASSQTGQGCPPQATLLPLQGAGTVALGRGVGQGHNGRAEGTPISLPSHYPSSLLSVGGGEACSHTPHSVPRPAPLSPPPGKAAWQARAGQPIPGQAAWLGKLGGGANSWKVLSLVPSSHLSSL